MNGKTHLIFGLFCGIATYAYIENSFYLIAGALVGSLLPDIDTRKASINKVVPVVGTIWSCINKISSKNEKIHELFKHRGVLTHSILPILALLTLYCITSLNLLLGLCIGILSHHMLDIFSPIKLRYFYPLKLKIGLFKVPEIIEYLLFILIGFGCFLLII